MKSLIPWNLHFDTYNTNAFASDHDLRAALGLILDELMAMATPTARLRQLRLEIRLSERYGILRHAYHQHWEPDPVYGNDSAYLGRDFMSLLNVSMSDPLIDTFCQADIDALAAKIKTTPFSDNRTTYSDEEAKLIFAAAIPKHVSLTAKHDGVTTAENIGIATDPAWTGDLVKDTARWFSEAFITAGVTIRQREFDNASGTDACVEIENKHPTKPLQVIEQKDQGSTLTVNAGYKTKLTEAQCHRADWKLSLVDPS